MTEDPKTEADHIDATRAAILDAALPHVMFDGWSTEALQMAIADSGVDPTLARQAFPRGGIDLAIAFHRRGDAKMRAAFAAADTGAMRIRDKITLAVRLRLEAIEGDRDAVRKAAALFALPQHAAEGAAMIWATADAMWDCLGDPSDDINWYTKRATLSGVYSATVLYWLGDDTPDQAATWAFLDRRIEDVMRIETMKARLRDTPLARAFAAGPGRVFEHVRAPKPGGAPDLPGRR